MTNQEILALDTPASQGFAVLLERYNDAESHVRRVEGALWDGYATEAEAEAANELAGELALELKKARESFSK